MRSHFVFKNGQVILTFCTKRQIRFTRVLYALRRVKFEGSSMDRKPEPLSTFALRGERAYRQVMYVVSEEEM